MRRVISLGLTTAIISVIVFRNVGAVAAETWNVMISSQKFTVNGQSVNADALNINGNHYIKVAEFAELLNVDISFDENTNTVAFDKSKPFTGLKTINKTITSNKQEQTVEVDIKMLEPGQFKILDLVEIKSGDSVTFDIESHGKGSLFIGFTKENDGKKPETIYYGEGDMFGEKGVIKKTVTADTKEGKYYFYISNQGKETMQDITGAVTITRAG